ncbi:MAG: type II toxin-antitoxin system prevent-host-death family antitoxin [bacterium]
MEASARDIRYHLKSVMEAVERGEEVLITNRGKIKARIVPAGTKSGSQKMENPFIGMWRDRKEMRDVRAYVRRIRKGRFS